MDTQTTSQKRKKDQFVALCADSAQDAERLLPVVRQLADKLHKGIIIFTCSPDGDSWVEKLGLPYAAMKSDWPTVVEAMPTAFNVLLAVVMADPEATRGCSSHPRQILRNFRQAKIAYMVVGKDDICVATVKTGFDTVALTLNHQRESKEKLLWASYFARFCQSNIAVYHHPYNDPAFQKRLRDNIRYMDKIFASLNITYQLHPLPKSNQFTDPDPKAVVIPGVDLFIALVSDARDRDFLDLISPPPPLRLLRHAPKIPILFLNQRDDLYIMCD